MAGLKIHGGPLPLWVGWPVGRLALSLCALSGGLAQSVCKGGENKRHRQEAGQLFRPILCHIARICVPIKRQHRGIKNGLFLNFSNLIN